MADPRHLVVLAFENRSFDHLLGFLPRGGELTGQEYNLVDPANPGSERVPVTRRAGPITRVDPSHSFEGVYEQVFGGRPGQPDPAPMSGFVSSYIKNADGDVTTGKQIMDCHAPESIPVLAGLAATYCVCTRWFASVPGPTWPNRFYMHAATSRGLVSNDPFDAAAPTIYDRLEASGHSWRIYAGDVPQCLAIERLAETFLLERLAAPADQHFHTLSQYFADLQRGSLPNYAFLEPQYFETPFGKATDQHPPHDIRLGEALLGHVYNSLLASDYWPESLLLVLFDEHGGFFDTVSPPTGVPNPDGYTSSQPAFDFTRLGVRLPAVVVSPLVEAGTVDATVYEHASIPATVNALFGLGAGRFLTRRDAAANTLDRALARTAGRSRADVAQADVQGKPSRDEIAPATAAAAGMQRVVETVRDQKRQRPLASFSSHQRRLVGLADTLTRSLP